MAGFLKMGDSVLGIGDFMKNIATLIIVGGMTLGGVYLGWQAGVQYGVLRTKIAVYEQSQQFSPVPLRDPDPDPQGSPIGSAKENVQ